MAKKRKDLDKDFEVFAKEFRELCDKHGLISCVAISATKLETDSGKSTIGVALARAGSMFMHEALCAWGFGFSSGLHVECMDEFKANGAKTSLG